MDIKTASKSENNYWKDRSVFVTGGTGFIGGAAVQALVDEGANVVLLVRDSVPRSHLFASGAYKQARMVHGSLEDYELIRRALSDYEVQTAIHFGAQSQVLTAIDNPLSTFSANITGTYNVLEAARQTKSVEATIIASSDKAYGISKTLPYTENMPLQGEFPYEVSKSCADLIAHAYHKTYGLPVTIARCGNTYGGGDLNFRRLVPKVIKHAINSPAQKIIMRSDGTPKRDFIYIDDVVDAYLMLAEKTGKPGISGEAFNFSSGKAYRVKDVVETLLKLMNSNLKPEWVRPAEHEIPEQYLSIEKAGRMLGWKPKHSLDEGLRKTVEWYRKFFAEKE